MVSADPCKVPGIKRKDAWWNMKSVDHSDLIKRIQDSARAAGMPPDIVEGLSDPGRQWEDADRRAGHSRVEAIVSTKTISRIFKKLFGRKKS